MHVMKSFFEVLISKLLSPKPHSAMGVMGNANQYLQISIHRIYPTFQMFKARNYEIMKNYIPLRK